MRIFQHTRYVSKTCHMLVSPCYSWGTPILLCTCAALPYCCARVLELTHMSYYYATKLLHGNNTGNLILEEMLRSCQHAHTLSPIKRQHKHTHTCVCINTPTRTRTHTHTRTYITENAKRIQVWRIHPKCEFRIRFLQGIAKGT
jgi:hypothetical protein